MTPTGLLQPGNNCLLRALRTLDGPGRYLVLRVETQHSLWKLKPHPIEADINFSSILSSLSWTFRSRQDMVLSNSLQWDKILLLVCSGTLEPANPDLQFVWLILCKKHAIMNSY